MCYKKKQTKSIKEVEKRFNANVKDKASFQTGIVSGFDYPKMPIITNDASGLVQFSHWGLIPSWAQDHTIRQYTLNARIETLHEKPSFKEVTSQRCLVIADGFYEWKWLTKSGSEKEQHLITLPNNNLYAFAGLWNEWYDSKTDVFLHSYTIVTTQASPFMESIHNTKKRMPIILKPEDENKWLTGTDIETFRFPYEVPLTSSIIHKEGQQFRLF